MTTHKPQLPFISTLPTGDEVRDHTPFQSPHAAATAVASDSSTVASLKHQLVQSQAQVARCKLHIYTLEAESDCLHTLFDIQTVSLHLDRATRLLGAFNGLNGGNGHTAHAPSTATASSSTTAADSVDTPRIRRQRAELHLRLRELEGWTLKLRNRSVALRERKAAHTSRPLPPMEVLYPLSPAVTAEQPATADAAVPGTSTTTRTYATTLEDAALAAEHYGIQVDRLGRLNTTLEERRGDIEVLLQQQRGMAGTLREVLRQIEHKYGDRLDLSAAQADEDMSRVAKEEMESFRTQWAREVGVTVVPGVHAAEALDVERESKRAKTEGMEVEEEQQDEEEEAEDYGDE
ncbi:uncharacterized protein EHS24_001560 [Apiotrichum porosum]|uniref:Uncharacterized protein n=1 Tax=Apiotrichum porosum TaxID=105984 RepID=A0A427XKZ4_9TREE|nr:uncharacterized protein EHS24_001560 [Apiotrichum porosum]RSH79508.1 hypothetical protein EHS24_001560 [Apiotrichum porosum]